MKRLYFIQDWAGNTCFYGATFKTWEDAEEYLCEKLDNAYETDRQEYYIELVESKARADQLEAMQYMGAKNDKRL